uniref:Ground-like domain-containing protein n=1 Tax=Panagrolaimus davidi TaxID=227884 RepID=A0A914QYN1_9BILA
MYSRLFAVIYFVVLFNECIAFGFGLGGGGGGGCGQPACGGGCGRKKREIIQPQIRTEQTEICPQNEWRTTMIENMGNDIETSKYAIQGALYRKYEAKFFVTCQPKSDNFQFVSTGEGYCTYTNDNKSCTAVALIG